MAYLCTIQESDIGRTTIEVRGKAYWLWGAFGAFQPHDIGKRLYLDDGVVQMENDAQRDKRLAKQ